LFAFVLPVVCGLIKCQCQKTKSPTYQRSRTCELWCVVLWYQYLLIADLRLVMS